MRYFTMNGCTWCVKYVMANSKELIDRTGKYRAATTDPKTLMIYISDTVPEGKLPQVLIHEMTHAAIFSYNLLPDIHRMVKKRYWVEAEEWVCNLLANHAADILCTASRMTDINIFEMIPREFDRLANKEGGSYA